MTETVLYDYWRSSASYRVRIALNLAGVAYSTVPVDLVKGEQRSPEHLARNPQGFVPALDIDGVRLTQSLAIIAYLDETRGLDLLPTDPIQRAKARALSYAIAIDIHPVCNASVAAHAREISGREDAVDRWMQRFIRPGMQAFETMMGAFTQSPYCCGTTPGLADICLMPQIYNARRWGVEIDDLARTTAVERTCAIHPAFAAAYPDTCKPA
ncbi:maleylacetoacetate isomerase [Sedimentitalea todarodis]|uniref:Maleylacetoacetate isomerase n=1 Tax=Sedimentitalea todarodis TaxID=1631240 RepID=A0ABU3V871_9RHOB|nr:maleylacetoacetate isomerase [Sedimentitalea todarodis]MDU9002373.1 maleylacetoacetate isomerase [Sedimentitalea todarodis]